ncbi:MAG: hypothetical protein KDC46_09150 [Thermoleophilia bacterium]|nr:hypothetical protein [Thermoleophilia bacterium]
MRQNTTRIGAIVLVATTSIIVAGCGGSDVPADTGAVTPTPAPNATNPTVGDPNATAGQDLDGDGIPDADPNAGATDLGATATIPDLSGGDIGGGLGAVGATPIFDAAAVSPDDLPKDESSESTTTTTDTAVPTTTPEASTFFGAKISIDGVVSDVAKGDAFPDDNPVFRLLSVTGSNIEIELIAGEFTAGGGSGVLIDKGEEVSLVNASEQLTYRITYLRGIKDDSGITL